MYAQIKLTEIVVNLIFYIKITITSCPTSQNPCKVAVAYERKQNHLPKFGIGLAASLGLC